MRNKSLKTVLATLLSVFLLSGCAGGAYLNTFHAPPSTIYQHDELSLLVIGAAECANMDGFEETRKLFEEKLVETLKENSRFKNIKIVSDKIIAENQLLMLVTINEYRNVSTAARLAVGAFAGAASFKAKVELYEGSSDNKISEMISGTVSKKSQGVFGANTSHQIDLVAKKIAQAFI